MKIRSILEKDSQTDKKLDIRDFFLDQFNDEDLFGDDLFKEKLETAKIEDKGSKKGGAKGGGLQPVFKEKKEDKLYLEDVKLIKYQRIRM